MGAVKQMIKFSIKRTVEVIILEPPYSTMLKKKNLFFVRIVEKKDFSFFEFNSTFEGILFLFHL